MNSDADSDSSGSRRRGVLAALGSVAASGCLRLTATGEGTTTASDAATRQTAGGTTAADGTAAEASPESTDDAATETTTDWDVELEPQWSRHLGPGEHVLDGDALYVADRDQTTDLGLLAVSVADGSRRWTVSAPYRTRSLALADDGTLYAGVGQLSEGGGSLYAVDAESGSAEAVFDADRTPTRGSPLVASDTVVFGTEPSQEGEPRLYGLARDDHDDRWSTNVDDGGYTGGVLADGTAYLGGFDYRFGALDPATGEWAWRDDWQLAPDTDPVVRDGSLFFVDADRGLVRLDPETGAEEWRHATERETNVLSHVSGPVFDGDTAFFTVGSTVHAAEVGGDGLWSTELPNPVRYAPAVVGSVVWVATQDTDVLHGLDPETGETAFRTQLPANTERTVVAGDRLLAFLDDRVLAFTASRP